MPQSGSSIGIFRRYGDAEGKGKYAVTRGSIFTGPVIEHGDSGDIAITSGAQRVEKPGKQQRGEVSGD